VTGRNVIHGSDSSENAKRETNLFFNDYELHNYEKPEEDWLFEK
jgi:nucleoside-diphosphate kinase